MFTSVYSRKNPFPARLVVNRKLTGDRSAKDTRHYEVSLEGSGLAYECGDSMGLFCSNNPVLADEIVDRLGFSGDELVPTPDKDIVPIREALIHRCTITEPDKKFLKALVQRAAAAPLLGDLLRPERQADLASYLSGMEIIDFLMEHPSARFSAEEFALTLRKLLPRLYSIASSQRVVGDSVHFTVGTVRYESHGRRREGVCSTWMADRVTPETPVPLFLHSAKGFRLPDDGATPILMVGPGTGIAPFRAFLQERQAVGATGENWLFFGDQHAATDFLYREEFEKFHTDGILTRFHTAFSRDQAHKIYVQDRLKENSAEVWRWLERGAHFFVCGDASRMAKDVDVALQRIVAEEGGMTEDAAAAFLEQMKIDKRYKRDVY